MNAIQSIETIATNPQVRGGRPFIVGTTITVADIAIAKVLAGLDADALAYYYEHKSEVDQSIAERRAVAAAMKEKLVGSRHPPYFG